MISSASLSCVLALLLMSAVSPPSRAQGPDLPPIPRVAGICRLADGPQRAWASYIVRALDIRVSHPSDWSVRETAERRIEFVSGNSVMVRLWAVNTGGVAPAVWLQRQDPPQGARCQMIDLGGASAGLQCFDRARDMWTTLLVVRHQVIAVEAPSGLSREVHCGILMSVREGS